MIDEMQRLYPEGMTQQQMFADIALASQTEFGCHMQYFFFELYGGGAGAAKWMEFYLLSFSSHGITDYVCTGSRSLVG